MIGIHSLQHCMPGFVEVEALYMFGLGRLIPLGICLCVMILSGPLGCGKTTGCLKMEG
jgi:hypothetical protein